MGATPKPEALKRVTAPGKIRPAPRQKPKGSYRIDLTPEQKRQIEEDIAAGRIPF